MTQPWWCNAAVYQIYIRSFMDTNGDGVGDMEGIRSRLPYIASLGVDAIWITPFYPSPMADHGYDVADYRGVDPLFGDLGDFDRMREEAHRLGLRVIVDIVPNHTSNRHQWFLEAVADVNSPRREAYIFRDPRPDGGLPNNWGSVFGGPAWTLDRASGQYYLHLFAPEQPDLNWRNPEVVEEFRSVLKFWLDRGADGFRIDVAHGLFKDSELRDNPVREGPRVVAGTQYHSLEEKYTWDQPEVHGIYADWRRIVDSYPGDRMMVGEVFLFDQEKVAKYIGPGRLNQAFNFAFAGTRFEAAHLKWAVSEGLRLTAAAEAPATWVLSNHDLTRHVTRYGGGDVGRRRARAVTQMLMVLPGSPYIYQGEELGAEEVDVPEAMRQDPIATRTGGRMKGRDGCRTPIPWSQEDGHGFTTGTPWLPFAPDAGTRNVAGQEADPASMLNWYRRCLSLRRELTAGAGSAVEWLDTPDDTMGFRRRLASGETLTCLLNTGEKARQVQAGGDLVFASVEGAAAKDGLVAVPAESATWSVG